MIAWRRSVNLKYRFIKTISKPECIEQREETAYKIKISYQTPSKKIGAAREEKRPS